MNDGDTDNVPPVRLGKVLPFTSQRRRGAKVRDILLGERKGRAKVEAREILKSIEFMSQESDDLRRAKIKELKRRFEAGELKYSSEKERRLVAESVIKELF